MRIACIAVLLTGCGAACPPPSRVALEAGDVPVGVPGDADVIAASAEHRWAVLWQAREDTDGNGVVHVYHGDHGARWGDRQDTWVVLGGGPGVRVERFLDGRGRWLAVVDEGVVQLIDATTGARTVLGPSLGEWAWDDDPRVGGGPEVRFAADEHVVWLATRDRIVVTSTSTEQRSEYALAGYWVAWAHTDATATWILAGVLARAPDDPGDPYQLPNTATSYRLFPCRRLHCGGPASAVVAFRIGDPRPILVHPHSMTRAWGLVTVVDHALRITRSADEMRSVGAGCPADLVHAGIQAPLVIYRCRGADDLMFSIDGSPPQPIAALDPNVLPEIDRELLAIDDGQWRLARLDGTAPAFWVGRGEHAWDPSTRTWRFYDWSDVEGCASPESFQTGAERRLASTHCIQDGTGLVHAFADDGTALVRRITKHRRVPRRPRRLQGLAARVDPRRDRAPRARAATRRAGCRSHHHPVGAAARSALPNPAKVRPAARVGPSPSTTPPNARASSQPAARRPACSRRTGCLRSRPPQRA